MAGRFWKKHNLHQRKGGPPLNVLGMSADYSPNPKSRELALDLPFDLKTGEMVRVWKKCLSWDPTGMIEKYSRNLKN